MLRETAATFMIKENRTVELTMLQSSVEQIGYCR